MHNKKIEKYAQETRKELIKTIKQKSYFYGVTEEKIFSTTTNSEGQTVINEKIVGSQKNKQRDKFIEHIDQNHLKRNFNQLVEEVAYTWFNRIIALRFLEVNDYLDHGIRVLSTTETGKKTPDIVENALSMNLDIEKEEYYALVDHGSDNELYKYVLIKQCNHLSEKLDFLFEKNKDYTELLLPDGLLDQNSFINKLVKEIPEEDFKDVEIIGWLYQYYISELKDKNIKKKKYKKEDIPSVTQLFTPHWIVQYMVQNSLGKLWLESHEDERQQALKKDWEYYLESAEQTEEVKAKLKEIINTDLKPEEITFLDPACGSGHILVYAFDIFYEIYQKNGYNPRVIVENILEKNLYGLDIDKRATQLSKFALTMRAKEKDRSILEKDIHLNIASIEESNQIKERTIDYFTENLTEIHKNQVLNLIDKFEDAKEYGSILKVEKFDYETLNNHLESLLSKQDLTTHYLEHEIELKEKIRPLLEQGRIMAKQYDVVTTNPPYGGSRKLPKNLKSFLKKNYSDSKKDLFAVFMEKCLDFTKENGLTSMVTMHSWMFLSSFEGLRERIIDNQVIDTMLHLGTRAFPEIGGEVVQTTTFTLRNTSPDNFNGEFIRLVDFNSTVEKADKTKEAVLNPDVDYRYTAKTEDFKKIPGGAISFWASENTLDIFQNSKLLGDRVKPKQGMATSDNNRFLRNWHEVSMNRIGFGLKRLDALKSNYKWFPFNKGGRYNKWYGNNEYVVNYYDNGKEIKKTVLDKYKYLKTPDFVVKNQDYYFKENATWSAISSGDLSVRYSPVGYIISNAGMAIYSDDINIYKIVGLMNSNVVTKHLIKIINVTLNFNAGDIEKLPLIDLSDSNIVDLVKNCINISKNDWDSFEISWDFKKHPLIEFKENLGTIEKAFNNWSDFAEEKFNELWENEEELNRIFIEIYGLEDELTPDVKEKDVTVSKADYERDIKSFISCAVGCMMGRYSLDEEGLAYAGGAFNLDNYESYKPDKDGIITILDKDYFDNDVVKRFVEFVKVTFGADNLEINLEYIASALSPRSSEQPRDSIRRYFQTGSKFYTDHCRMYNKRPIYWKVSSGGRNPSFMALINLHRYDENTFSNLRVNYVHPLQRKLKAEKGHLQQMIIEADSKTDESTYKARISDIDNILHDLIDFDEKLGHLADQQISIDLDDGVKENYKIFKDILDKIR